MTSRPETVTVCGATDVGKLRDGNEDTFVICDIASGTLATPREVQTFSLSKAGILLMVCDGMGGAAGGEVAARLAAETVARGLAKQRDLTGTLSSADLVAALRLANQTILDEARLHITERGMGTTCTAGLMLPGRLVLAQVGDSRAYLLRNGALRQLTRDQSLARELVDLGVLSPDQVSGFTYSNVILQALGEKSQINPVTTEVGLSPGDVILFSSDGLHGPVSETTIGGVLRDFPHLANCTEALIDAALAAGGPDNVTAILARYDGVR